MHVLLLLLSTVVIEDGDGLEPGTVLQLKLQLFPETRSLKNLKVCWKKYTLDVYARCEIRVGAALAQNHLRRVQHPNVSFCSFRTTNQKPHHLPFSLGFLLFSFFFASLKNGLNVYAILSPRNPPNYNRGILASP